MKNVNTLNMKTFEERLASYYEKTGIDIVKPGVYEVRESNYGGDYDIVQFRINVTTPIAKNELAKKLYEELRYISTWPSLSIKEVLLDEYTDIKI